MARGAASLEPRRSPRDPRARARRTRVLLAAFIGILLLAAGVILLVPRLTSRVLTVRAAASLVLLNASDIPEVG